MFATMKINAMAQEVAQTMMTGDIYYTYTKIEMFLFIGVPIRRSFSMSSSSFITAAAKQNKTTLEMLLHLQKLIDDFKEKVTEMDEEMRTVKLENTILKNKINELTSSNTKSPSRRGFFGYGTDEF